MVGVEIFRDSRNHLDFVGCKNGIMLFIDISNRSRVWCLNRVSNLCWTEVRCDPTTLVPTARIPHKIDLGDWTNWLEECYVRFMKILNKEKKLLVIESMTRPKAPWA